MARADPLPPALRGRPFTVAEAAALGVSRDVLRGKGFRAPHRGVRVPAALPDSLQLRCRAAALVLPPGAVFAGRTALHLHALPDRLHAPDVLASPLEVLVPPTSTPPRTAGVASGQSRWAARAVVLPGTHLRALEPAQLWCDLAPDLPQVDAVALGDAVLRHGTSSRGLAAAVAERRGEPGVVRLREVLALVRHPVDSPMETRTRLLLVGAGIPEPVCGRPVVVDGGWIATPDLSWPQVRVALEYDGGHHRRDARQWANDIRRRQLLEAHGWRVLVVTAADVLRWPEQTVALVAQVLRERGLRW